jgi:hypothetical protein
MARRREQPEQPRRAVSPIPMPPVLTARERLNTADRDATRHPHAYVRCRNVSARARAVPEAGVIMNGDPGTGLMRADQSEVPLRRLAAAVARLRRYTDGRPRTGVTHTDADDVVGTVDTDDADRPPLPVVGPTIPPPAAGEG